MQLIDAGKSQPSPFVQLQPLDEQTVQTDLSQKLKTQLANFSPGMATDAHVTFLLTFADPQAALDKFKAFCGASSSVKEAGGKIEVFRFVVKHYEQLTGQFPNGRDPQDLVMQIGRQPRLAELIDRNPEAFEMLLDGLGKKEGWAEGLVSRGTALGRFLREPESVLGYYRQIEEIKPARGSFIQGGGRVFLDGLEVADENASMRQIVVSAMQRQPPQEHSDMVMVGKKIGVSLAGQLNQIWEDNPALVKKIAALDENIVLGLLMDDTLELAPRVEARLFDRLEEILKEKGVNLTQYLGLSETVQTIRVRGPQKGPEPVFEEQTKVSLGSTDFSGAQIATLLTKALAMDRWTEPQRALLQHSELGLAADFVFQPLLEQQFSPAYALLMFSNVERMIDNGLKDNMLEHIEAGLKNNPQDGKMRDFLLLLRDAVSKGVSYTVFDWNKYLNPKGQMVMVEVYDATDTAQNYDKAVTDYTRSIGRPKKGPDGEMVFEDRQVKMVLYRRGEKGNLLANADFIQKFHQENPDMVVAVRGHAGSEKEAVPPGMFRADGHVFVLFGQCWGAIVTLDYLTQNKGADLSFSGYFGTGHSESTEAILHAFIQTRRAQAPPTSLRDIVQQHEKEIRAGGVETSNVMVDATGQLAFKFIYEAERRRRNPWMTQNRPAGRGPNIY